MTTIVVALVVLSLLLARRARQRGEARQARAIAAAAVGMALVALGMALRDAWRAGRDDRRPPADVAPAAARPRP